LRWWRRTHPNLLLHDATGQEVVDRGWNERLLDIGTRAKRRALARIVGGWIDGCARRGFQAIEPDNLDSWTRSKQLLTAADAVAYAGRLSRRAHRDGLLVAQKNAVGLAGRRAVTGFDFAIAEECQVYRECAGYTRAYGRAVIEIEYTDNGRRAFTRACALRGSRISIELVDRDVLPAGTAGHVRRFCRS
jgi:glycosyl hydrolase family 114